MKSVFSIEVAGEHQEVVLEALGEAQYRLTVGERTIELSAQEVAQRQYQLIHETKVFDAVVTGDRPAVTVYHRSGSADVALLDEAQLARQALSAGQGQADGAICAPMPGKVVKALVAPGDEVTEAQGVIVVEAMKMENELRAAKSGTVKEILVAQGDSVDAGQKLVIID